MHIVARASQVSQRLCVSGLVTDCPSSSAFQFRNCRLLWPAIFAGGVVKPDEQRKLREENRQLREALRQCRELLERTDKVLQRANKSGGPLEDSSPLG
jgi:hypothetical protein